MLNVQRFPQTMLGLAILASFAWLPRGASAAETRRFPNILLILADDLGWGSVGCYGADRRLVRTPNIDRLAKEGRRFTDANTTSSVCSPTRYSVLTGRYCWRTSLEHGVLSTFSPLHIEAGRLNMASLAKKHGYRTAAIGKWHLGYGAKARTDYTQPLRPGPLEIGFDYHFGVPSNHGDVSGVYVENDRVVGLRSASLTPRDQAGTNFKGTPFLGLDAPQRVDEEVMPLLTDKAVAWLGKQHAGTPFFLYYTPVTVHNPVTPSEKTKGTSGAGPFGDWIHELDVSVGRVLEALDRQGLAKNTLVVFTSDNGGVYTPQRECEQTDAFNAGLKVNGPWRGGKHSVFEGGFRVPFLVRWPGHVAAGSVCDEMLSLADLLATTAAILGEPLPSHEQAAEDSYNMLPALLAESYPGPLRPEMIVHSADGNFAIRQGPWKWIEGGHHPATRKGVLRVRAEEFKPQLYHLGNDPSEQHQLGSENPQIVRRLSQLLETCRTEGHTRSGSETSP